MIAALLIGIIAVVALVAELIFGLVIAACYIAFVVFLLAWPFLLPVAWGWQILITLVWFAVLLWATLKG